MWLTIVASRYVTGTLWLFIPAVFAAWAATAAPTEGVRLTVLVLDAIGVVLLEQRVVGPDLLDEAAVAGRVAVGDDDRVVGALLSAATGETDLQHLSKSLV